MDITWKDYRIFRLDDKNIVVDWTHEVKAQTDQHNPGTGEMVRKEGESYMVTDRIGYFARLQGALQAILDHYPTQEGVNDLTRVISALNEAKKELIEVLTLETV